MDIVSKGTGDSLTATEFNQIPSELENAISSTGQSPSDGDLFQVSKAIADYAANGDFYTDSGAADAYILSVIGSKQAPTAYVNGMKVRFIPGNTNTGSSTINVATLGVKNIISTSTGGQIVANVPVTIEYRSGSGDFAITLTNATETVRGIVELATNAETVTGTDTERATTPAGVAAAIAALAIPLLTKVVNIGDWDMIASGSVNVAHGLTYSKIRSVTALLRNDADSLVTTLPSYASAAIGTEKTDADSTNIVLTRAVTGVFNSTNYDSTSYNRGWVVIQYAP